MSENTERLYRAAQEAFHVWRRAGGLRFPASHEDVAAYLHHVGQMRGDSVVPVHLSAIARLYRNAGRPLDVKHKDIQRVVGHARERMRGAP